MQKLVDFYHILITKLVIRSLKWGYTMCETKAVRFLEEHIKLIKEV